MAKINYEKTMKILETFMIKSGIRKYCINICRGHCCRGCDTTDNSCINNEGRRLACSAFMCRSLMDKILSPSLFSWYEVSRDAIDAAAGAGRYGNMYYRPWSYTQINKFSIDDFNLSLYTDKESLKHIKSQMKGLKVNINGEDRVNMIDNKAHIKYLTHPDTPTDIEKTLTDVSRSVFVFSKLSPECSHLSGDLCTKLPKLSFCDIKICPKLKQKE